SQQRSAKKIPLFVLFDQFLSPQKRAGSPFKNISKKVKEKLASLLHLALNGNLARQNRAASAVQKYLKKSEKKACKPLAFSVNRESSATNRPRQPFKNILKKVKKSLQACKISNNPCQNLTKPMEKLMIKNVLNKFGFVRVAFVASVGFPLMFASNAVAQLAAPAQPAPPPAGGQAEVERVIVTGSNIPTAEETGP